MPIPSAAGGKEQPEPSYIADGNVKCCNHFGKAWQFLKKLHLHPACDPVILYQGIYLREMKAYVHTKTWTEVFPAAFVDICNTGNTWNNPQVHPWVKKQVNCGITDHTVKYYSAIKGDEILIHATA